MQVEVGAEEEKAPLVRVDFRVRGWEMKAKPPTGNGLETAWEEQVHGVGRMSLGRLPMGRETMGVCSKCSGRE